MIFKIISDLHLEFMSISEINEIVHNINNSSHDCNYNCTNEYLILAGDITTYKYKHYLNILFYNLQYTKIFFILGNHEYYHSNESINVVQEYRNICKEYDNVVFLENDKYIIENGPMIIGATLWSNIDNEGYSMMADHNFISKESILKKHNESLTFIIDTINNTHDTDVIVITHHLPSKTFILPKYKYYNNTGFASNCDELFKKPITHWIFGHTHTQIQRKINGVNFLCNPLGYKHENAKYDYELKFIY